MNTCYNQTPIDAMTVLRRSAKRGHLLAAEDLNTLYRACRRYHGQYVARAGVRPLEALRRAGVARVRVAYSEPPLNVPATVQLTADTCNRPAITHQYTRFLPHWIPDPRCASPAYRDGERHHPYRKAFEVSLFPYPSA